MYSILIPGLKFTNKKIINHSMLKKAHFLHIFIGGDLNKYELITKN